MSKVQEKLKKLPKIPGVYIFRDKDKKIIYVGKAVNLKNRVGSYFSGLKDIKTQNLILSISNLEWMETGSEVGALLLESELIKRYKPKFNIDLKDNKNFLYLKIPKEDFPLPVFVRNPSDDKAKYLGPFTDAGALKRVFKMIRKVFPWRSKGDLKTTRPCLYYHLNQCPGVCVGKISKNEYQKNIRGLLKFFEGKSGSLIKGFEKEMGKVAKEKDFEKAAFYRDKIRDLNKIYGLHILKEEDFAKRDSALSGLRKRLDLKNLPRRIECFDISNISGREAVGSMVIFENGMPKKEDYRKFKIKIVNGIDDVAMMREVLERRFRKVFNRHPDSDMESGEGSQRHSNEIPLSARNDKRNQNDRKKEWDNLPDLIIVDGGKGQLGAALEVLKSYDLQIPAIGLAKKNEEIWFRSPLDFSSQRSCSLRAVRGKQKLEIGGQKYDKIILPEDSEVLYLLQRIRDEAHRFAITYFRSLHAKSMKKSAFDNIPGIGPKTKKKLVSQFGSVAKIKEVSVEELGMVVGEKIALKIKEHL